MNNLVTEQSTDAQDRNIEVVDQLFEATTEHFWMHESFYDRSYERSPEFTLMLAYDNEIMKVNLFVHYHEATETSIIKESGFVSMVSYKLPNSRKKWNHPIRSRSHTFPHLAINEVLSELIVKLSGDFSTLPAMAKTSLEPLVKYKEAYSRWVETLIDIGSPVPEVTPETLLSPGKAKIFLNICDVCKQDVGNTKNPDLYDGFLDKDTGIFVGNCCKKEFYRRKNSGEYGERNIGKVSEFPEIVRYEFDETGEVTEKNLFQDIPSSDKERVKHIVHAIDPYPDHPNFTHDHDWTKPENHRIFPFYKFESFHVQHMKLVCDGCGEAFVGNGSYDTGYFVHEAPQEIRVYHSLKDCRKGGRDLAMDYVDQIHGFVNRIQLHHSLIGKVEYELVFSHLDKFACNAFVPGGFKSIKEAKEHNSSFRSLGGGGTSIKGGFETGQGMKLTWDKKTFAKNPQVKLTEAQTLKITNEILALSPIQQKVTGYVILTTAATPKPTVQASKTKKNKALAKKAVITTPIETIPAVVDQVSDLATPKVDVPAKVKSITESYPGGKNASGTPQFLINMIPPVDCIVSGFLGHCAVMKNIKPAKLMVGMDIDKTVIERWSKERPDIKLIADDFLKQTSWINPKEFGKTLVFLDPPYLLESRSSQSRIYDHEFYTEEQHRKLLEKVIKFPASVMICAYENELYDTILLKQSFRKVYYMVQTQQGRRQEVIYVNFEEPTELHDYSFVGNDYRERWNNKKLVNRMIAQLKDMPPIRRNMIIHHVQQNFKLMR